MGTPSRTQLLSCVQLMMLPLVRFCLRHSVNVQDFIEAARQADIRTPLARAISNGADLEDAIGEIGFPAVLKADGTWGGDGVAVVQDRDEAVLAWRRLSTPPTFLRSVVRAIRRSDAHFLRAAVRTETPAISMQKFIPGTPATTSFACWRGKLLVANHLETLAAQRANGPASVLRRIDDPQMDEAALRLAARFELSGLHGLDYIRDEEGQVHLIEINPRATQGGTLAFGAGRDLPAALAASLSSANCGIRPAIENDIVAFFPRAWQPGGGEAWLPSAHHDIPWDDPAVLRAMLAMPADANDNEVRARIYR